MRDPRLETLARQLIRYSCAMKPGERVLIQPPVYGPFRETILRAGRAVAQSPLEETGEGWREHDRYTWMRSFFK